MEVKIGRRAYSRLLGILCLMWVGMQACAPVAPEKAELQLAKSLNNSATLFYRQGRYSEAEPLFRQALEIRDRVLGREHPAVAVTLINLASVYLAQGKYANAEPLYKRSLEIFEKAFGPEHLGVATRLQFTCLCITVCLT